MIIEKFEIMDSVVKLIQNPKSNVIGHAPWTVTVKKPKCTKQLNFSTELEALISFNNETLELLS